MPVEIREIIIKTEIVSPDRNFTTEIREKDLNGFRKNLLEECKRIISENTKRKNSHNR